MDKYLSKSDTNLNNQPGTPIKRVAEDIQWRVPKRPALRQTSSFTKIQTDNRFTGLSTEEGDDPVKNIFRPSSNAQNRARIPPIFIQLQADWTHGIITDLISKYDKNFVLQYRGNNQVAVMCKTIQSHQLIKEGLKKEDAFFFTYTRKDEKPYKAVIHGLPANIKDQISNELEQLGFRDVVVTVMKNKINVNKVCPPYLVQLPAGTNISKFRQMKYICNCVINIRKYRSSQATTGTQCFRCQQFGHASRNCNLPARCVKCTENHHTNECSKKDRQVKATCCNCSEDHPANYRQCPERQKYLLKLQQLSDKRQQKPIPHEAIMHPKTSNISTKNATSNKRTWASVVGNSSAGNESPLIQNTRITERVSIPLNYKPQSPDKETDEILGILQAIKAIKTELKPSSTLVDKVVLVIKYLGQYV